MADAYVTEAEFEQLVGSGWVDAVQGYSGLSLTPHIEFATALVQSRLRNNGYAVPSGTIATTTNIDPLVKSAVVALAWESLASVPKAGLRLPDEWESHPFRIAWADIYSGVATLNLSITKISAKGGWKASSHSTTTTTGLPQRSRRRELEGY